MKFKVRNKSGGWFVGHKSTTPDEKDATVYDSECPESMKEVNVKWPAKYLTVKVVI